jgi:alpha-tubulin suppressor-like RCC1 family protein
MRITTDGFLQKQSEKSVQEAWGVFSYPWENIDTDVRSFQSNHRTTFYIKNDNTLWGFGSNFRGWLGDGTGVDKTEPVRILNNVATVASATAGRNLVMYAITTDKTLMTWGDGNFSPVSVASDVVDIQTVLHSHMDFGRRTFIRTSDGHTHQIGANFSLTKISTEPALVSAVAFEPTGDRLIVTHYINSAHSLMWRNESGNYVEIATDIERIFGFARHWVFFRGDSPITRFIKSDGSLWGFGHNANGELGDGTKLPRNTPVKIADNVVYVFLKQDGTYWTWNSNVPTPQQTHENVVAVIDGDIYFNDGTVLVGVAPPINTPPRNNEFDNVRIPRTVTFE